MFNFAFKRRKPPSAQLQLKFEELLFLCNSLTAQLVYVLMQKEIPELEVGEGLNIWKMFMYLWHRFNVVDDNCRKRLIYFWKPSSNNFLLLFLFVPQKKLCKSKKWVLCTFNATCRQVVSGSKSGAGQIRGGSRKPLEWVPAPCHCSWYTAHCTLFIPHSAHWMWLPGQSSQQPNKAKTFATIKKAHCDDKNCVEDTVQVVFGEKPRWNVAVLRLLLQAFALIYRTR